MLKNQEYNRVREKIAEILVKYNRKFERKDGLWVALDKPTDLADLILSIKGLVIESDNQSLPEYPLTEWDVQEVQQDMKDFRRIVNGD